MRAHMLGLTVAAVAAWCAPAWAVPADLVSPADGALGILVH
jgi:hypothetical protein